MTTGCFRAAAACAALLWAGAGAAAAWAQQTAPPAPILTLLTAPPAARIALHGVSRLTGPAPLDLPLGWSGRYSVRVGAPGYATGQFLLAVPSTGQAPYSLSEAPGLSAGLLFRAVNAPGVPALSSGHPERGLALAVAAAGSGFGAVRAEILRSRDSRRGDAEARDRTEDDRVYRNRWLGFAGVVWAMSALDYAGRARVQLLEATPTRVTLGIPRVTRGGMLWRSLLVPGGGQEFAGQSARGTGWLAATLACGAAYLIADFEHQRDLSRLSRAEAEYAALDSTQKSMYLPALAQLRNESDTSRRWRGGFATATVGLYALNVIDALAAPIRRDDGTGQPRFSLSAPVAPDQAALQLSYRF